MEDLPQPSGPIARRQDVVVQLVGESGADAVIYDPVTNQAHALDAAATAVWQAADGSRDLNALAASLRLPKSDTDAAVEGLLAAGLIVEPPQGQTRRTLLRRAAVAGAVSAPIVLSLELPAIAAAASGTPATGISGGGTAGSALSFSETGGTGATQHSIPTNATVYIATANGAVSSSQPSGNYVEIDYNFVPGSGFNYWDISVENQSGASLSYTFTGSSIEGTQSSAQNGPVTNGGSIGSVAWEPDDPIGITLTW